MTGAEQDVEHEAMHKLIIQIPCYNEEAALPVTLGELPRAVAGFDTVEWLVVDDGSSDRTVEVARAHGVDHVVRLPRHQGLATAFREGLNACVRLRADVIVNTDADNQYQAADIPTLVRPITDGRADVVVGCRPIEQIQDFSWLKKRLQRLGSLVVRIASATDIPDAPSGFRAFSRYAAVRLSVLSRYTYTLETLIRAGQSNLAITWVNVRVNGALRPSRLMKNMWSYLYISVLTILRFYLHYRAFKFLTIVGVLFATPGIILGLRFLWFFMHGDGAGHVQSLILASLLITMGFLTAVSGLLADLLNINRSLLEDIRARVMLMESDPGRVLTRLTEEPAPAGRRGAGDGDGEGDERPAG